MTKQIIALVLLSLIVVLSIPFIQPYVEGLLSAHEWIAESLKQVFAGGKAGEVARQLLALLSIPFLVGIVPAFIYWLAKRSWFPYFMEFVWIAWLIEVVALIILYKAPTT